MSEDQPRPGWQSVYTLVRDTRADLLREVETVAEHVRGLDAKIDIHLLEHAQARGASAARATMLTATLTFMQRAIPVSALVGALLALMGVKL